MDQCSKKYSLSVGDLEIVKRFKKILTYGITSVITMLLGILLLMDKIGALISPPSIDLATSSGIISLVIGSVFLVLIGKELRNGGGVEIGGSSMDTIIYTIRIFKEKRSLVDLYEKRGLRK